MRKTFSHANQQSDRFTSIKYQCEIETDWIENIEEGLVFVEKAIREDRQFIRTEGEVVTIEKVKKVSKTSVEHLSRHGNFITRAPKEKTGDLIPDKLYIVEKLSDYLVYENRFIYMLLCYLRDFIQMRLDKILDKTTTYQSQMVLNKQIEASQRHIQYQLHFDELTKNDPFLVERYKEIPNVNRIETIFAIVNSLFSTSLMRDVAKAPMIKPPVVKTNVLRMNPNFRAALKLYDYIMAYNKDGFTFQEIKKTHNPLPMEMSDEIAETIQLNSLITYVVGNDLHSYLDKRFEADLMQLEIADADKKREDIRRLKKRILEMHEDPAEYILTLERRNIELEKEGAKLVREREINEELNQKIVSMQAEMKSLSEKNIALSNELAHKEKIIDQLNQKYFDDMTYAEALHQTEMKNLEIRLTKIIAEQKAKYEAQIHELIQKHQKEVQDLTSKYEKLLTETHAKYQAEIERLTTSYEQELASTHAKYQSEILQLNTSHAQELASTNEKYQLEIQNLTSSFENELLQTHQKYQTEKVELITSYEQHLSEIIQNHLSEKQNLIDSFELKLKDTIQSYESNIQKLILENTDVVKSLKTTIQQSKQDIFELENLIESMKQADKQERKEHADQVKQLEKRLSDMEAQMKYANAQYHALKMHKGLITDEDDFSSKDQFEQLEMEMIAYKKLFKEQWKRAKTQIRESAKNKLLNPTNNTSQPVENDSEESK